MHKWIRGELQRPPPPLIEGLLALEYLNGYGMPTGLFEIDQRVHYYKSLLTKPEQGRPDISVYFESVAKHRHYVRKVFQLWLLSHPDVLSPIRGELEKEILERCRRHDLSKYAPEEILGYFFKWFQPTPIGDGDEKLLWTTALEHHYQENDHHPEFYTSAFGNLQTDPMTLMSKAAMVESCIDMLACRLERTLGSLLQSGVSICPEQMFSIPMLYLERFGAMKRDDVCVYLFDWVTRVSHIVSEGVGSSVLDRSAVERWQTLSEVSFKPREASEETEDAEDWQKDWSALLRVCIPLLLEEEHKEEEEEVDTEYYAGAASVSDTGPGEGAECCFETE